MTASLHACCAIAWLPICAHVSMVSCRSGPLSRAQAPRGTCYSTALPPTRLPHRHGHGLCMLCVWLVVSSTNTPPLSPPPAACGPRYRQVHLECVNHRFDAPRCCPRRSPTAEATVELCLVYAPLVCSARRGHFRRARERTAPSPVPLPPRQHRHMLWLVLCFSTPCSAFRKEEKVKTVNRH